MRVLGDRRTGQQRGAPRKPARGIASRRAATGNQSAILNKVVADADRPRRKALFVRFVGPRRFGQVKAAQALASRLKHPLYRVNLATMVSQYIGETEKNLDRVFARASSANAILFFDEADALFGKRTSVRDSHDRYANMEVNYLLQRLESYRGLVILATNSQASLGPAFARRLRHVVDFRVARRGTLKPRPRQ